MNANRPDQSQGADIEFRDVTFSITEGRNVKQILKNVTGKFNSGELNSIMGPSGAGKSSLMSILAGFRTSNTSGLVLMNGVERKLRNFRKISRYIQQDDYLLSYLTVHEAVQISASLKLQRDTSAIEKEKVVNGIIDVLGLADSKNTMTIKLSGGQRKRLSIGLELANCPSIIFLDEPTSGLDSSSCFDLILLLKTLAKQGHTVICTIHQPSSRLFEMFDNVFVLASGRCIFQGTVPNLVPFLAANGHVCPSYHNPADFVIEVASSASSETLENLCAAMDGRRSRRSSALKTTVRNDEVIIDFSGRSSIVSIDTEFSISLLAQFWILLKRSLLTIFRDRMLTTTRLICHALVAAILAIIYYDVGNIAEKVPSNTGCMFFSILFTMFTSMMPMIMKFPSERSVCIHEHLNRWYSLKAYYMAKTVADLPLQTALTAFFVTIVYIFSGQPSEWYRFGMFVLISVLTALVAQTIGLLIGAGLDVEAGVFIGPVSTIPTILFSGFFVNFKVMPSYLQWLTYVSYVRFGFEGAILSLYSFNRELLECESPMCYNRDPKQLLEAFSMDDANYSTDAGTLLAIFVILKVVGYFILKWKVHSER